VREVIRGSAKKLEEERRLTGNPQEVKHTQEHTGNNNDLTT